MNKEQIIENCIKDLCLEMSRTIEPVDLNLSHTWLQIFLSDIYELGKNSLNRKLVACERHGNSIADKYARCSMCQKAIVAGIISESHEKR